VKNLLQQHGHSGHFCAAFSKGSHFDLGTIGLEEGAQFLSSVSEGFP
jgi:hypothetical protein